MKFFTYFAYLWGGAEFGKHDYIRLESSNLRIVSINVNLRLQKLIICVVVVVNVVLVAHTDHITSSCGQ